MALLGFPSAMKPPAQPCLQDGKLLSMIVRSLVS